MIQTTSSKFSLPKKLYVFFGAVCLSLSIIGTVLMFQKNRTFDSLNEQNTAFKQMSSFSNAPGYIDSIALAAMDSIVDAGSLSVEKELVEEVDKGVKYFQDNKNEIYAVFKAAGKESLFQEYEKSLSELTKSTQSLFEEIPKKPSESVLADFDNKIDTNATVAKNILSDVKESFEGVVSAGREKANSDISFMSTFSLSLSVCCFILVIALGIPLVRSIINPLKKISDLLNGSSGILEKISESLVNTSNELNDVTAQQSSAVQESVASIAEISATISQTSEHARESSQQAQTVMGKTEVGAQVMEKMVNSMNSIQSANSQLQNIAKIINEINQKTNVINDIVFKTQLLAFNASIEAARAGQHGRGFAVVANEVGNLAQLSGNAANQIQALLEDSKSQVSNILQLTESRVQEGQSVCREAKSSFEDMFQSIRKIVEQMQSISDAAVEQDVGVKQTTDAMGLIDVSSRKVHQVAIEATRASTDVKLQCKQISKITFEVVKMVGAINTNEQTASHPAKFDKIKKTQQSLGSFDADDDSFKDAA